MSDSVYRRTVQIVNDEGLHMRPANQLAQTASRFESQIEMIKDDLRVDGKSITSILMLGAPQGTFVSLEGCGPDAQVAVDTLAELVESGFKIPLAADTDEAD